MLPLLVKSSDQGATKSLFCNGREGLLVGGVPFAGAGRPQTPMALLAFPLRLFSSFVSSVVREALWGKCSIFGFSVFRMEMFQNLSRFHARQLPVDRLGKPLEMVFVG